MFLRFIKGGKEVASVEQLLSYWHQSIRGKTEESKNTENLIHYWFELWDLQKFKKKYLVNTDDELGEKLGARHHTWAKEVNITHTPTFFVNGYELPKEYAIDDLLAMVPSLQDSF